MTNISQVIVNKAHACIVVGYDNAKQIKEAIITLKDNPQLCENFGNNGLKAFLNKYNWNLMERQLHQIYENLISNDIDDNKK